MSLLEFMWMLVTGTMVAGCGVMLIMMIVFTIVSFYQDHYQ